RDAAGPKEIQAGYVSGAFFDVLGVKPFAGRLPAERDTAAAVVSRRFASKVAGGAADVLGRSFVVGGRSVEIVGVLPSSFGVFDDRDIWMPAQSVAALNLLGPGDARSYQLIARIRPGRSLQDG